MEKLTPDHLILIWGISACGSVLFGRPRPIKLHHFIDFFSIINMESGSHRMANPFSVIIHSILHGSSSNWKPLDTTMKCYQRRASGISGTRYRCRRRRRRKVLIWPGILTLKVLCFYGFSASTTYMHAMELFSSFEGLWQVGWRGEELGESCRYAGKMWLYLRDLDYL